MQWKNSPQLRARHIQQVQRREAHRSLGEQTSFLPEPLDA